MSLASRAPKRLVHSVLLGKETKSANPKRGTGSNSASPKEVSPSNWRSALLGERGKGLPENLKWMGVPRCSSCTVLLGTLQRSAACQDPYMLTTTSTQYAPVQEGTVCVCVCCAE